MNRSVDSRSDLYACGVILYELLTGGLPFTASDPMEWIHCHLTRTPVSPDERVNTIPASLAAIVMKLLAKNADDRYQTAAGLEADLRMCLDEWRQRGEIEPFPLGLRDVSDRLVIPQRLYGRERDIEMLLAAFHRVVSEGRSELALVSGYSGIGKSAVVHELHRVLVPPRGLFASGKFDQLKRDVPYATLARALRELVSGLLVLPESELACWRDQLREALGAHGQLLVGLVPELAVILGPQPTVADLPPGEAQNRFERLVLRFLALFARAEHPLVLFLDDLQWLDAPTLHLVEQLVAGQELPHLLLVCAYRDIEVGGAHPVARMLERLRRTGSPVTEIVLAPLTLSDLTRLVGDTLRRNEMDVGPLARLLHEKTGGNPFFAIQLFTRLADDGVISFDAEAMAWRWDLAGVEAMGYTDNVVHLMVGKLALLPHETREALRTLASLGHRANEATLAAVQGTSAARLRDALAEAVHVGLLEHDESEASYRFAHDRIHEAAYSLVADLERPAMHLRIGRLLRDMPRGPDDPVIFDIVSHLNLGESVMDAPDERLDAAKLNLTAGLRAKAATAFDSALLYFAAGERLMTFRGGDGDDCHDLRFALALHRAECEIPTGNTTAAEPRLLALVRQARTLPERSSVACARLVLHMAQARPDLAVHACLEYLRDAERGWPSRPDEQDVRAECDRVVGLLNGRPIESLLSLPLMSDADRRATMDVLCAMVPAVILTNENLLGLVIARMAAMSIEHGCTDSSCYAFVLLNMVLGVRFGDPETGFRFGELSVDLVEQRGLERFKARVLLCFGITVLPWNSDIRGARSWIRRAFEASLESGDFIHCAYSCNNLVTEMLASGDPLNDAEREAENGLAFARKARFGIGAAILTGQLLLIRRLRGVAGHVRFLDGELFDQTRFEHLLDADAHLSLPACWYWVRTLQACLHLEDHVGALEAASNARRLLWTSPGFFETAEYHFHAGVAAALAATEPGEAGERHRCALAEHHERIVAWRTHCPDNFADRAALLEAEIARLDGRTLEAMRLYEEASRLAHARGFVQHEALAQRRAARCCAALGLYTMAQAHLHRAREAYERWGAHEMVRHVARELDEGVVAPRPSRATTTAIGTSIEQLDLATVVGISQAVSSEVRLDLVIDRLMSIALQHAGADRGLLVLPRGDELHLEAEASNSTERINVRAVSRRVTPSDLPLSILTYVERTREYVSMDDAVAANAFSEDAYLKDAAVRSVLCLPLVKQTALIGLLYLENTVASHAFTSDRVAVLKLLASQAAVSVENARLYADLRQTEAYLAEAQSLSQTGSFGWRPATGEIYWSAEHFRVFGVDPSVPPTLDLILSRVHPDDRAEVQRVAERAARDGSDFDIDYRLLLPNRTIKHVRIVAHGSRDAAGALTFIGAVMDVTAAKRSQQELEKALEDIRQLKDQLQEENVALREEIDKTSMFEEIVGVSSALRLVLSHVAKVAPTDSTVLITGETGTGKELIARAIHRRSVRSARPFVSVNCAAIPSSLIASELFGHEKGAFTGASERRVGRFELADGGTLFLDEVGELPAETQVALLRVLQERAFERVGGSRTMHVNVRVIAATNRDLEAAVDDKTFRADLFYRLNVFPLAMPALRERRDDIPLLVEYFTDRFAKRAGKQIRGISRKTLDLLMSYDWPGNIRELQNVVERAIIVSETGTLAIDSRWLSSRHRSASAAPVTTTLVAHERAAIESALAETKGRVSGQFGAAQRLGVPASTLETKIKALAIDKRRFKSSSRERR